MPVTGREWSADKTPDARLETAEAATAVQGPNSASAIGAWAEGSISGMPDLSLTRLHRTVMARVIPTAVRVVPRPDVTTRRLGTEYGGWWVPISRIDANSIVYSVGIGEDASFDLALAEQTGCTVHAFDPTPRALKYLEHLNSPAIVTHPYGIWAQDGTIPLFLPENTEHVSLSVVDRFATGQSFDLPVRTLASAMAECGHSRIDLLKMDIEGAEAEVLDQMLETDIRPAILAVEFERVERPSRTIRRIRRLKSRGYLPVAVERNNVTLVLDESSDADA